jgi:tetratricopeptide (TPR) repeat protein
MTHAQNDPFVLRQTALGLWDRRIQGELLEPEAFRTLVEATFRLAVHPATPPDEALVLLRRARRLDPANPKHVYHLGLLQLRHGRLAEAAEELREAAGLAPTSHRIWAHLAIVQRRLDEESVGTAGYTGAFRRRAEQISSAIRDGADNPDPGPGGPEPSPHLGVTAVRLDRGGACRWSGVSDLDVEERLLGTPSERTRDWLLAELTELARLVPRRSGGVAAFAVLGVEWLLRGYPKAILRRMAELVSAPGPAFQLLTDVLDLYDLPAEQVPARLATHQREETLPSFLILLLHRSLLLTRPLEFPDLAAHRAARELLAAPEEPGPAQAAQCAEALMAAVRRLAPAPVERVADAVATQPGSNAEDLLLQLETGTALFKKHDAETLDLARTLRAAAKTADASGFARLSGDLVVVEEIADVLKSVVAARLADWDTVGQAERGTLAPDEFQRRYQAVKRDLQNTMHGRTKKQLRLLKEALTKLTGGGTPEPSAATLLLLRETAQSMLGTTAEGPPMPARPQPEPSGSGRELAGSALAIADKAMAEVFAQARATLTDLPPGEALDLLLREVSGREAETAYRLGHTAQARQIWSRMLATNPYHTGVLQNLAMAQTAAGDLAAAAEAWQACLCALYALDVAAGDPRGHAAKRAELHGALAGAFGTAALAVPPQDQHGPEARVVTAVLASSARVAAYERHLRLELLNRRIAGHGVRLRLGVSPDAPQEVREAARERAVADAHTACASLPDRIARPFAQLCEHVLTEDESPRDHPAAAAEADKEAHTDIVKRLFAQKRRLRAILIQDRTWCLSVYSGDVIAALARVDSLPLDASDDVTVSTVLRLESGAAPVRLIEELNQLADFACKVALNRVLDEAESDDPLFPERFRGTGESWARTAVPEEYLTTLDNPGVAHPQLVRDAVDITNRVGDELDEASREIMEQAVSTLATWTDRLRGASGPPILRADLLRVLGRHAEAYLILDATAEAAFALDAGERIERARIRVDFATHNFAAAVARVRGLLATGETDELKGLLSTAYRHWINVAAPAPDPADIDRDFASWTDPQSIRNRRFLMARATLARLKGESGARIATAMERLLAADPGNRDAEFHLIVDGFAKQLKELRLRERESQGPDRRSLFDTRRKILKRCRTRCEGYLAEPDDADDPLAARRRKMLNDLLRRLGR